MQKKELLKKWIVRVSSILLPVSIGFVVVAITLLLLGNFRMPRFWLSVLSIGPGILLWYAGVLLQNKIRFFFASTFLLLTGVLLFIIDLDVICIPLPVIWPLMMLFIALSFLVSGLFRYRKLHAPYVVPAIAFSLLGFLFLLFSTKVINASIVSAALWWVPFLLLPLITFIIWLFQRRSVSRDVDE